MRRWCTYLAFLLDFVLNLSSAFNHILHNRPLGRGKEDFGVILDTLDGAVAIDNIANNGPLLLRESVLINALLGKGVDDVLSSGPLSGSEGSHCYELKMCEKL